MLNSLIKHPSFRARNLLFCILLASVYFYQTANAAEIFSNVGRSATPAEIAAWDIDVRPDFKGLPSGSGSVAKGMQVWEAKCESCHGTFGESNEVFTPMTGGINKQDMVAGNVATLKRTDFPQRTTLMKLSQLSTLWDYINRAMPWNAPKSLTTEEVYAVSAYILNLGDIVPADFVLSDKNIRDVQAKLPNRNGLVKFDPLWDVIGKPDVQNTACMTNCKKTVNTVSSLPDFARNAHGNLAEQNRLIGAVRGMNTEGNTLGSKAAVEKRVVSASAQDIAKKFGCVACHAASSKLVGPSYNDIATKYKTDSDANVKIATKIRVGGSGVWGVIPMPAHPTMTDEDLKALVAWSLSGGG